MLERLCTRAGVSPADRQEIMTSHHMQLGDCAVALELEAWSAFVKVYIDIGEPAPAQAHEMYRYFLEQQLYMPVPFQMLAGVHPESGRFTLCAGTPLPMNEEDDTQFLGFLDTCLMVVNLFRSDVTGRSLEMAFE